MHPNCTPRQPIDMKKSTICTVPDSQQAFEPDDQHAKHPHALKENKIWLQ